MLGEFFPPKNPKYHFQASRLKNMAKTLAINKILGYLYISEPKTTKTRTYTDNFYVDLTKKKKLKYQNLAEFRGKCDVNVKNIKIEVYPLYRDYTKN